MITSPKNLTEQLLNLVERIAQEMKVILNTAVSKADKNHTHTSAQVTDLTTTLSPYMKTQDANNAFLGKTAKASSASSADRLATANTIALAGAVTGNATAFDGSESITINTTSVDGSKVNGTVASATKTIQDANGNVITDTYATKTEVDSLLANKQNIRTAPLDLGMVGA